MSADHRIFGRITALASVLSLVTAVALASAAPSVAQDAAGTVTSDKEGWWNRLRGAEEEAAPANPLTGVAPVPAPPASVPEGAIAVGALLGETDKVAAVGVVLPIERGGSVERLGMTLLLAEGEGAQGGDAPSGVIQACPVTGFFVPEENGEFQNRPTADCALASAPGTRSEDGSWTFDLTTIASLWVDPAGTLFPNGVLLEPVVEPPASFQVSFAGAPEGIAFDFAGTPGGATADPFAVGGEGGGFADGGFDDGPSGDGGFAQGGFSEGGSLGGGASGGGFDTGGTGGFPVPEAPAPPPTPGSAPPGPAPTPTAGGEVSLGGPAPVSQVGNTLGNLPGGSWLLLVLGLGLALVAMVSLGPAGETAVAVRRTGGVSRALDQRSADR